MPADPTRRPPAGASTLEARVRAAFPSLDWAAARYIDAGWDHEVLILTEVTEGGRRIEDLVLRFPLAAEPGDALAAEIDLLAALAGMTDARLPQYTHVGPDRSFAGYPLIPGLPLTGATFALAESVAPGEAARQLAEVLTVLHTRTDADTDLGRIPDADMHAWHADLAQVASERLPDVLTAPEMATVRAVIADVDRLLEEPPPARVLLHGDVYEEHLLWDAAAQRLGLIDFSDTCLGDPAHDFAELGGVAPGFREAVYARYEGPRDPGLLDRAERWERWVAVFMLTENAKTGKLPVAEARRLFDRLEPAG